MLEQTPEKLVLSGDFWQEVWYLSVSEKRAKLYSLAELKNFSTALAIASRRLEKSVVEAEKSAKEKSLARQDAWRYWSAGKKLLAKTICDEYGLNLDEIVAFYQAAGQQNTTIITTKTTRTKASNGNTNGYKFELIHGDQVYPAKVKYHALERAFRLAGVEKPAEGIAAWQEANGIDEGKPFVINGKQFMFRKAQA